MKINLILDTVVIGTGATLAMDLWNLFLKRVFSIPSLNYCFLGRWFSHMPSGAFRHEKISASEKKPFECAIGRVAHYTIGMALALGFILLASGDWLAHPTLLPALLYGFGTVVFPLFIMQPSLGLGIASSRTPKPTHAKLKSFATHTVFGAGLFISALAMSYVLGIHA